MAEHDGLHKRWSHIIQRTGRSRATGKHRKTADCGFNERKVLSWLRAFSTGNLHTCSCCSTPLSVALGGDPPSAPQLEMARWGKTTAIQVFSGPPPPSAPTERIGSLGSFSREKPVFSARQSSYGALGPAKRERLTTICQRTAARTKNGECDSAMGRISDDPPNRPKRAGSAARLIGAARTSRHTTRARPGGRALINSIQAFYSDDKVEKSGAARLLCLWSQLPWQAATAAQGSRALLPAPFASMNSWRATRAGIVPPRPILGRICSAAVTSSSVRHGIELIWRQFALVR